MHVFFFFVSESQAIIYGFIKFLSSYLHVSNMQYTQKQKKANIPDTKVKKKINPSYSYFASQLEPGIHS